MAIFPDTNKIKPLLPYDNSPTDNVKRTPPEAGNSFIRDVWGAVRFNAKLEFMLAKADYYVLWAWYELMRTSSFTFYDFEFQQVTAKSFGTGNGSTTTFALPGKTLQSGASIYINGVLKTLTTDYTITEGNLTSPTLEGETRITFVAAPANGLALTFTGVLRRKYTCEFAEPAQRRSNAYNRIYVSMNVRERFPLAA